MWPTAEGWEFDLTDIGMFGRALDLSGIARRQQERARQGLIEDHNYAYIVSYAWQGRPYEDIVQDMMSKGLSILKPDTNKVMLDDKWKDLSLEQVFMQLFEQKIQLQAVDHESLVFDEASYKSNIHFKDLDYTSCRLPKLNQTQLTDPAKGLWELFGSSHLRV